MPKTLDRRRLLKGTAAAAATAALPYRVAVAETKPLKLGLLADKTGPLAQGGIEMEMGLSGYLKDRGMKLAGRAVELIVADTGSTPAGTKNKAQQLVERDAVDAVCGPLAAFELLAISDYMAQHKMPVLSLAAAEDITQRKPNPYFIRASASSAQAMHPLADYAAKQLKYKTALCISDDFAFGYEQIGGFQRVFEGAGGRVVKKLWPPLGEADYTPYLAQISGCDCVVQGFASAAPVKFMKQYADAGLKFPVLGGEAAGDDMLLNSFGDEAVGMITAAPYSDDLKNEANEHFLATMKKDYDQPVGQYAALLWLNGVVIEAALKATGGNTDPDVLIKALRAVNLKDTLRGPVRFDEFGNVIGDIFIRKLEKSGGKLVNRTVKTYHDVSQFWTYDPKWFLAQPVYSRDYPPLKA